MAAQAATGETPDRRVLTATVTVAILAISTAAILIRLSDAPALIIAFWRLAIATVILAVPALLVPRYREGILALTLRDWLLLGAVGVVLAIHFASWIESLALTSVAASVTLVTLHPVFVGLASSRLFGEGLPARAWIGVLAALGGGAIIAFSDSQRGPEPLLGDLLALIGALAAAIYFLAGRGFRRRLPLLAYVVPVYATTSVALVAMALIAGDPLTGWPVREYVLFAALAIVPMILGHTLLNYALKYVTAPVIATTVLGEPVGSTILALIILSEVPPWLTVAGAVVVLAGIGLVVLESEAAPGEVEEPGL